MRMFGVSVTTMAAAILAGAEKATQSKTLLGLPFGWGAIFSALSTLGIGAAIRVYIKERAANKKIDIDGETQLRNEMWKDIEKLKMDKTETSRRLTIAETKLAEQASEIGQLRFLIALVNTELERVSPGNAIAKQVRIIMDDLQSHATSRVPSAETAIMADIMTKMCLIHGGEKE